MTKDGVFIQLEDRLEKEMVKEVTSKTLMYKVITKDSINYFKD